MSMPRLGSYAEWQRTQAAAPRSVLVELIQAAAGAEIEHAHRIMDGYSNEVYRVRCSDGQDLVVRILRFDTDVSRSVSTREARAIELARAAGVPAPEILLLDTVHLDSPEFPVMVQRAVPGHPLHEVIDGLSEYQRYGVFAEIGGLIARLNQVVVDNHRDWSSTMAVELATLRTKRSQVLTGGFSATEFDQMLKLLEGYVRDFPGERWVLCHGDLSLKHIFVTGGANGDPTVQVSGIIDFGDWQPGTSVHDLAVFRARSPRLDLLPLLAGYGTLADDQFRHRLDLHTLTIALDSLAFGVVEGDQVCIDEAAELIRALLDDLSS